MKKKCPYCAEEIKRDAIVCKHCHLNLQTGKPFYENKEVPNWVLVLFLFVFIGILFAYGYVNTQRNLVTVSSMQKQKSTTATKTKRSLPTHTPRPTTKNVELTLTAAYESTIPFSQNACIEWDQVSSLDLGKEICVQGVAKRWYSTDNFATVVRFTENPSDFFVVDREYIYYDFGPGSCFKAIGIVKQMGQRHYLEIIDGIYYCEP